jgi:hypothetical protein
MHHCPGTCNSRYRAAEDRREEHGDPNPITPTHGEPAWCRTCTERLGHAIRSMPDLAARLQLEVQHGTPPAPEHVSGSKEQPLHAGDGACRMIEEIRDTLTGWEDEIRAARGFTPRDPVRLGVAITASARFLAVQLDWALANTDAVEHDHAVRSLKRRVEHAVHLDDVRPRPRYNIPCKECDLLALEHQVDDRGRSTGDTRCAGCGAVYAEDEIQAWVKMLAAYYVPQVTA